MNDGASVSGTGRKTTLPAWPLAAAGALIVLGLAGLLWAPVHALDIRILLAMRHPEDPSQLLGPPWVREMLRDFMGLGGEGVQVIFIACGLGVLWLAGRRREAYWFLGGVVGAFVIGSVLKHLIARPRPELIPHGAYTFTASFPSGHTMMATVVWSWLALALADAVGKRAVRDFALAIALVIAFVVGASRVYMGVHWPSDVVESWGLGIAWVWALRYLRAGRLSVPR